MTRKHVHFAAGLATDSRVVSGMRKSCDVFVHLDAAAALADRMPFFLSSNGVILSPGIDGLIPPRYFARVVDKAGNDLLNAVEPSATTDGNTT
jgi:2'-phosphotransferase